MFRARSLLHLILPALLAAGAAAVDPLVWGPLEAVAVSSTIEYGSELDLRSGVAADFHLMIAGRDQPDILYARRDDGGWGPLETAVGYGSEHTARCALAQRADLPRVMYMDYPSLGIKLAFRSAGGVWSNSTVFEYAPEMTRCALEVKLDLSYHFVWSTYGTGEPGELRYTYSSGADWLTEVITTFREGYSMNGFDFAFDEDGGLHVAWEDGDDDRVMYAHRIGTNVYEEKTVSTGRGWVPALEMGIISPGIPYMVYVERIASSQWFLRYAFSLGAEFYDSLVSEIGYVYSLDLAIDGEAGLAGFHPYIFLSTLSDPLRVYFPSGASWASQPVEAAAGWPALGGLSAEWNPTLERVGLALTNPTNDDVYFLAGRPMPATATPTRTPTRTPTAAPSPAATPTCGIFGVQMVVPAAHVSPGDAFFCHARLCNPSGVWIHDQPFVAMLDVGIGEYWFYPTWTHYPPEFDFDLVDLAPGTTVFVVLPDFAWPDTGADSFAGINLYGAFLTPEMDAIAGDLGVATFSYGP